MKLCGGEREPRIGGDELPEHGVVAGIRCLLRRDRDDPVAGGVEGLRRRVEQVGRQRRNLCTADVEGDRRVPGCGALQGRRGIDHRTAPVVDSRNDNRGDPQQHDQDEDRIPVDGHLAAIGTTAAGRGGACDPLPRRAPGHGGGDLSNSPAGGPRDPVRAQSPQLVPPWRGPVRGGGERPTPMLRRPGLTPPGVSGVPERTGAGGG